MQFQPDGGINILYILGTLYDVVNILSGPALVLACIIYVVRKVLAYRYLLAQPTILLGLTPPSSSKKTPYATEQFNKILYSLSLSRTRYEWLIGYRPVISLELPASRRDGIRYAVRISVANAASFQQRLAAYVPEVRCAEIADYLVPAISRGNSIRIAEFMLARNYVFPLAAHDALSQHDPIAYILSAMTKLETGEQVVLQYIVSACQPRSARRYSNSIHMGKMPNVFAANRPLPYKIAYFVIGLPFKLLACTFSLLSEMHSHSSSRSRQGYYSASQLSDDAKDLMADFRSKLGQPLFRVSIRAVVVSDDDQRSIQLMESLSSSIRSLNVPGKQGLVQRRILAHELAVQHELFCITNRLPTIFLTSSCILSASEVASLYHFPYGDSHTTEGYVTSLSHTLPAPLAVRGHADDKDFDVIFGMNYHHGGATPIGLTLDERARHMYVIGGTGNGKTTMLLYAIIQDITHGKGVAVIDPHGDLAETILNHIPEDRLNDVIYFNPQDADYPIGMNLLEIDDTLTGTDRLMAQDFVTEALVSVFRKIFSDDNSGGHRIEHALRYAVHTAFTVPNPTLFTVRKLLINDSFRKPYVARLQDEDLKEFWTKEFALAGSYQKYKKIDGVTTKIGRFERSVAAKRILEQPQSTIDFDDILNGKILICNLSKGTVGEDTSELFGTTILAKLQLAAYRRIRIPEADRKPFHLYVDEFQNFATPVFTQILSESRKYKLYITMAEQSTSQQDKQIVENILNNAGTVVSFRTANPEDEQYMLHQFQGSVHKGEIPNLSAFHFYMRIAAVEAQQPFSGETVLAGKTRSEAMAERAIAASRQNYAIAYEEPNQKRITTNTETRIVTQTGRMRNASTRKQQTKLDDIVSDEDEGRTDPGLADNDPVTG